MDSAFEVTTPRLRCYAPTLAEVEALRHGQRDALGARIGATVSAQWWLGPNLIRLLPDLTEEMQREPGDARWIWMVIDPAEAHVIGDIGFHGPLHDDATVEIGYSLIPQARGRGYTTEAATALLRWTFAHTQVAEIIAQIDPANAASLRVAEKLAMQELPPRSAGHRCFCITRSQAAQVPWTH